MAKNPNSPQSGQFFKFQCLISSAPRSLWSGENPLSAGIGLHGVRQKRERTGTSFLYIDSIKDLNISTEVLLKKR